MPAARVSLRQLCTRQSRVGTLTWQSSAQPNGRSSRREKFGLPEKARTAEARKETGNYPMPDAGHALSAKRLARTNRKDGNLTKEEFDRIERKADQIISFED
jgi:hypothetical protein